MKLPVSDHTTTITNDTDGQGSVNGRGNLLVNMFLELPRRREKPRQKPVCTLLQDILITRNYAGMEVLPEHPSVSPPPRAVGEEYETPFPACPIATSATRSRGRAVTGAYISVI